MVEREEEVLVLSSSLKVYECQQSKEAFSATSLRRFFITLLFVNCQKIKQKGE